MIAASKAQDNAQGGGDPVAGASGATSYTGTPDKDYAGNAAYQRMQALLERVHAQEDARRGQG